jgi:rhodanese-related sulfurtransferase/class 3 adenylate cyclase
MTESSATPVFLLSPQGLHHRLQQAEPMLLLDVRRADNLSHQPTGIHGAIPVVLKEEGPDLPDVDRDLEIVIYGSDEQDADSDQVAQWLASAGYRNLWRLEGGFAGWRAANLPTWQVRFGARDRRALRWTPLRKLENTPRVSSTPDPAAFLRGLRLPTLREVTALRLSVIETAPSFWRDHAALDQVQRLMQRVVSVASRYPAEVHDFEGDGTTLYFASPEVALRAAFELRSELCATRVLDASVPLVRLALDSTRAMLCHVGPASPTLRCIIGLCFPTALRIIKQAPPGGIVTTARVLKLSDPVEPALCARFKRMPNRLHTRNAEQSLPVFLSLPDSSDLALPGSPCSTHS